MLLFVFQTPAGGSLVVNSDQFHSIEHDIVFMSDKRSAHVAPGATTELAALLEQKKFKGKVVSIVSVPGS
jgi:hypothetical protein